MSRRQSTVAKGRREILKMTSAMSFWAIFGTACYPVAEVLLLCFVGAALASRRVNKFPPDARKHLNHMVFLVFTPALVFVNLAPAASIAALWQWWFLPFSVLLNSVLGAGLGYLVAVLTKPPPHLVRLTVACCAVGNMSNLPLVLIGAMCSNSSEVFGPECSKQGLAYSSYGMLMGVVVMWVFAYPYLEPPGEIETLLSSPCPHDAPQEPPLLLSEEDSGSEKEDAAFDALVDCPHSQAPAGGETVAWSDTVAGSHERVRLPRPVGGEVMYTESEGLTEGRELGGPKCWEWHQLLRRQRWDRIVTPPVSGVVCAILVGAIAPLKSTLFGPIARFKLLADVIVNLAGAMTPCMMLVLGGNIAEGPTASTLRAPTIFGIGCVRLIVLPVLGIGVLKCADALSLLPPNDLLFRFVVLLQTAMPTTHNIGIAATMYGTGEKETSALLFWTYLASTLTIPAFTMLFLYSLL